LGKLLKKFSQEKPARAFWQRQNAIGSTKSPTQKTNTLTQNIECGESFGRVWEPFFKKVPKKKPFSKAPCEKPFFKSFPTKPAISFP